MSQEPYTALYTAPLRRALRELDERLLRCFIALSTYADERGICFPGVRELASVTGFNVELVIELLAQLEACGMMVYLRRNERDPVTKRQLPNVYAITSQLYFARDPVEAALFASTGANLREKPDRKLPSSPIHNQNQKNQDQETSLNQNQNHHHNHQPTLENEGEAGSPATENGAGQGRGKGKKQGQKPNQNSQRSETAPQGAPSPLPPSREPDSLVSYLNPLRDPSHELIAQDIISLSGNITHANARMLVDVYGAENARAALVMYTLQPKNTIPNPGGYIRALLRRHAVSHEDIDAPMPF